MSKGRLTRETILQTAFEQASQQGLESLTIGSLASACEMSKSGLFAHFQSRDNLQIAVLEYAAEVFRLRVIQPVRQQEHQSQHDKLIALLRAWLAWNHCFAGRCMFLDAWTSVQDGHEQRAPCSKLPGNWCASGSTIWPVRWCRVKPQASGDRRWIPGAPFTGSMASIWRIRCSTISNCVRIRPATSGPRWTLC